MPVPPGETPLGPSENHLCTGMVASAGSLEDLGFHQPQQDQDALGDPILQDLPLVLEVLLVQLGRQAPLALEHQVGPPLAFPVQ